jgi:hypothetical protein
MPSRTRVESKIRVSYGVVLIRKHRVGQCFYVSRQNCIVKDQSGESTVTQTRTGMNRVSRSATPRWEREAQRR